MKLLYIDDDDDIREIAELSLAIDPEYRIWTAASGREGLDVAAAIRPDVILLDVMMPEMDGPETFAALAREEDLRAIPVIFITARTQSHQVAELQALGAAGVIEKPFDPLSLAEQVRGCLGDNFGC